MPTSEHRYKTVRVTPQLVTRLQESAEALHVSVNAVVLQAGDDLAQAVKKGWRAEILVGGGEDCFLPLRLDPDRYDTWVMAAKRGKLSVSDFLRIAAVAGLHEIEGKKRVMWPLEIGREQFSAATNWAKAEGWA